MKRFAPLLLPLFLLTACASVYVPPADYEETADSPAETAAVSETVTETEAASAPASTARAQTASSAAETDDETDDETETVTETEPLVIPDWAEGFAAVLRLKNADSEHIDACYALIRLDADEIPELAVFDDVTAELYYFADGGASLLLEDGYKSPAASGQNLCYQPETGRVASAFSTMGGGCGFNFFFYETLDPRQVMRYCFNTAEAEGGEMPYNPLWDRAEEFDVLFGGEREVSLGESWTHIGTDYEDIHKLAAVTGKKLALEWADILQDIHDPDEMETETDEETSP